MNKKILVFILIMVMSLLMVGCYSNNVSDNDGTSNNNTNNNTNNTSQECDIVFKVNGDTYATKTISRGERVYQPDDPIKENYNFAGWSDTIDGELVTFPIIVTENKTFYAKFDSKQETNKKAFIKYISNQTKVPAQNGNPEFYKVNKKYNQLQFILAYFPTEDKIAVFDTINSHGTSSIMVEWKYGKPNTMMGMVTHETSKTYDYAYLNRVYLNDNNEMGLFILSESTLDFDGLVKSFLENINTNINQIENEISGTSSDFNLYLGN